MIASFSVVPMGVGEELKEYVAQLVPIIEASGIDYAMGAMQTTLEGDADAVMTYTLLLPPTCPESDAATIIEAISKAARDLNITIVGGHTGWYASVASDQVDSLRAHWDKQGIKSYVLGRFDASLSCSQARRKGIVADLEEPTEDPFWQLFFAGLQSLA